MRKLVMMMALMAGMTAQANEMNDTTVISKADKVTIMAPEDSDCRSGWQCRLSL